MDVLALLAYGLPAIIVLLVAVRIFRVARVMRMLQRPELLGSMFSPEVRRRLEAAGLDPDDLDPTTLHSLEADPELRRRVHDELRAAFGRVLSGRSPTSAMQPAGGPLASATDAEDWRRPEPIGRSRSRDVRRWGSALLFAALLACCAVLLQR
jgi:hypothetical protein